MTNPTTTSGRARKGVQRAYRRLGTWRLVAQEFGNINVRYVYEFAVDGKEPVNQEARYQLGLEVRPKPQWLAEAVKFLSSREIIEPVASREPNRRCYTRQGKVYSTEEN